MMKERMKKLLRSKKLLNAGSVLLAAVVLGTGAWTAGSLEGSGVPELTTFVDLDDQISIAEDETPLASAPKVTTTTKTTKKVVKLKKKSTRTYTVKKKPKTVVSPAVTKTANGQTTTTTKKTTTSVSEKYKKNSKKKTVITVKKVTTTVKTVDVMTNQNSGGVSSTQGNSASTNKSTSPYTVAINTIAPKVDARVAKAYQGLNFEVIVNSTVSYAGYFDARTQSITMRQEIVTVYHELGLFVAFVAGNVDTKPAFQAVYQAEKSKFTGSRKVYAVQNASEFFAECFREYTLNPAVLRNTCPETYNAIETSLNKITDSHISQIKAFYGSVWK